MKSGEPIGFSPIFYLTIDLIDIYSFRTEQSFQNNLSRTIFPEQSTFTSYKNHNFIKIKSK